MAYNLLGIYQTRPQERWDQKEDVEGYGCDHVAHSGAILSWEKREVQKEDNNKKYLYHWDLF